MIPCAIAAEYDLFAHLRCFYEKASKGKLLTISQTINTAINVNLTSNWHKQTPLSRRFDFQQASVNRLATPCKTARLSLVNKAPRTRGTDAIKAAT
jgi:hypothetical protein